ncbi:hypothetical protein H696_02812 [Fonticula alba]|uniref:Uncharacterized protein n=1 Tax=Fonticula alba TaxID=691883 RepID=A0A058Z8S9_FONAL|nr:hypothetical protein H696_02812 [Fonticula alba]KCV70471.1 hypothetical protein H696_02812 [Fonticula alba]|eukprot:XP_009494987.1 hypothetical protein H696_02812 [Fonticula alba]
MSAPPPRKRTRSSTQASAQPAPPPPPPAPPAARAPSPPSPASPREDSPDSLELLSPDSVIVSDLPNVRMKDLTPAEQQELILLRKKRKRELERRRRIVRKNALILERIQSRAAVTTTSTSTHPEAERSASQAGPVASMAAPRRSAPMPDTDERPAGSNGPTGAPASTRAGSARGSRARPGRANTSAPAANVASSAGGASTGTTAAPTSGAAAAAPAAPSPAAVAAVSKHPSAGTFVVPPADHLAEARARACGSDILDVLARRARGLLPSGRPVTTSVSSQAPRYSCQDGPSGLCFWRGHSLERGAIVTLLAYPPATGDSDMDFGIGKPDEYLARVLTVEPCLRGLTGRPGPSCVPAPEHLSYSQEDTYPHHPCAHFRFRWLVPQPEADLSRHLVADGSLVSVPLADFRQGPVHPGRLPVSRIRRIVQFPSCHVDRPSATWPDRGPIPERWRGTPMRYDPLAMLLTAAEADSTDSSPGTGGPDGHAGDGDPRPFSPRHFYTSYSTIRERMIREAASNPNHPSLRIGGSAAAGSSGSPSG